MKEALEEGVFLIKQDVKLLNREALSVAVDRTLPLVVEKHGLSPAQVDWFLPHYSSEYYRTKLYDRLKEANFEIPFDRWFSNLSSKGNTGAASIYIIMEELFHSGRIKKGERLLCFVPESGRFSMCYMLLTAV
jgi:3-oxoacyl-[acyl-carrier-protein] synthase III